MPVSNPGIPSVEIEAQGGGAPAAIPETQGTQTDNDLGDNLANTRDIDNPEESLEGLAGDDSDASTQTEEEETENENDKGGATGNKEEEEEKKEDEEAPAPPPSAPPPPPAEPMEALVNPAIGNLGVASEAQKNSQ